MSDEKENGGGSLKSILIGLASTVALGVGGYVTKQLTGEKDEPAAATSAPAPVINITNSQTQQQSAGGKTIIINKGGNGGAAKAAQPAPPKPKKEADEFKEKPAAW
jgi:hypothetical protein